MSKVFLVSCVGKKSETAAAAADLYQSLWFKKARVYVELQESRWFILSALHGLLNPTQVVEPYNYTLSGQDIRKGWAYRVRDQIMTEILPSHELWILAGENYRDPLRYLVEVAGYKVQVPMRGLGIGKQLSWLTKEIIKKGQN